jgi:hypothetical protein
VKKVGEEILLESVNCQQQEAGASFLLRRGDNILVGTSSLFPGNEIFDNMAME